jgi:hypothetical protein
MRNGGFGPDCDYSGETAGVDASTRVRRCQETLVQARCSRSRFDTGVPLPCWHSRGSSRVDKRAAVPCARLECRIRRLGKYAHTLPVRQPLPRTPVAKKDDRKPKLEARMTGKLDNDGE